MALIVEDGTGLATAESYISVADAIDYLDSIATASNAFTAATSSPATDDQERALRAATNDLNERFGLRWKGYRINSTMALDWPRNAVLDEDGYAVDADAVPEAVKRATAELALRFLEDTTGHATSRLAPDLEAGEGGSIEAESLRAGPAAISTTYAGGAEPEKVYTRVERMLAGLLRSGGRVVLA